MSAVIPVGRRPRGWAVWRALRRLHMRYLIAEQEAFIVRLRGGGIITEDCPYMRRQRHRLGELRVQLAHWER